MDSRRGRADSSDDTQDILEFKEGISADSVTVARVNDNLILSIDGTTDQVTVQKYFNSDGYASREYAVDVIRFADGTEWTIEDVKTKSLFGSEENDFIEGFGSDDTIRGFKGNDSLTGGAGNDQYLFKSGDDMDTINNYDTNSDSIDTAIFEEVSIEDLWFSRSGNHLQVNVAGTEDQGTINNWYSNANYQVDQIETESSVLLNNQVEQLVSAMASYDVPSGAGSVVSQEAKDDLQPLLAEVWKTK